MKIISLRYNSKLYTCSAYLILDHQDKSGAHNTLIDIGSDGYIIDEILSLTLNQYSQDVAQVILTHKHSDHTGGLQNVLERFNPQVYAFSPQPGVSRILKDGDRISCAEQEFLVLHTPGHSEDSICLYCPDTGTIFSGDTSLNILEPSSSYPRAYADSLERISQLDVRGIYPGHSRPIMSGCNKLIKQTLDNVRSSCLY